MKGHYNNLSTTLSTVYRNWHGRISFTFKLPARRWCTYPPPFAVKQINFLRSSPLLVRNPMIWPQRQGWFLRGGRYGGDWCDCGDVRRFWAQDGSNKFILVARTKSKSCFAIVEHREEKGLVDGWLWCCRGKRTSAAGSSRAQEVCGFRDLKHDATHTCVLKLDFEEHKLIWDTSNVWGDSCLSCFWGDFSMYIGLSFFFFNEPR